MTTIEKLIDAELAMLFILSITAAILQVIFYMPKPA
jgi:hypothetical protein